MKWNREETEFSAYRNYLTIIHPTEKAAMRLTVRYGFGIVLQIVRASTNCKPCISAAYDFESAPYYLLRHEEIFGLLDVLKGNCVALNYHEGIVVTAEDYCATLKCEEINPDEDEVFGYLTPPKYRFTIENPRHSFKIKQDDAENFPAEPLTFDLTRSESCGIISAIEGVIGLLTFGMPRYFQ